MERHPKWGLALGGGGARGIAHVGVLKVLQRENLIPDVITGTSIGALVGGAFACRPDAAALEERLYEVLAPDAHENKPLKQIARFDWTDRADSTLIEPSAPFSSKGDFSGHGLVSQRRLLNGSASE